MVSVTPPYTVLVAEDEPAIRRVIVRRLRTLCPECIILEAADGTSALALLTTPELSGVVTDHLMPGATGLDLLAAVRAQSATIPVIFVSAHAGVAANALSRGATLFLDKPFTLEQLDAALRMVLTA
jgi:CheY-like chemotaxis protein